MKQVSKLHYIVTNSAEAEQACKGGVDWIQLRLKNIAYDEYKTVALEVQAVCRRHSASFIINDTVNLALDIHADGVHIGKEDMPPANARKILGENFIIGCTANTLEDIIQLSAQTVDYIGLGPYRFTNTKERLSPVLGVEGYRSIFTGLHNRTVNIPPVIAIGGITENDVEELLLTGLHGIAVSGAISNSGNIVNAAQRFNNIINNQVQQIKT